MRRYGRTLVGRQTATQAAYAAMLIGSDKAPYSGDCESPVVIPLTGMVDRTLEKLRDFEASDLDYGYVNGKPHWRGSGAPSPSVRHVDVEVRCRKCEPCRRARRNHWIARAKAEIAVAPRSWFGTLTLAPDHQFRLVALASVALKAGGTDYRDLSSEEQFKERCKPLVREVQLYLKRMRKAGAKFRYLIAFERHKSGAPHLHLLLHEVGHPVRHRLLSSEWKLGFSKYNLVAEGENGQAAYYVAKYLTKEGSRLLASARYGRS